MATTRFYLDTRNTDGQKEVPLKLAITNKTKSVYISLGIKLLPNQWNSRSSKITNHPRKQFLNNYIAKRKQEIDDILLTLSKSGLNHLTAVQIKERVMNKINFDDQSEHEENSFYNRFLKFADSHHNRTRELYYITLKRISEFIGGDLKKLKFEDITASWLCGFDTFLTKKSPSQNARNIHMRNIRAVFNDALDDEVTTYYPFRKFHIRGIPTSKRSLSVEELRALFARDVEPFQRQYIDIFKLIFFLEGINIIDLYNQPT